MQTRSVRHCPRRLAALRGNDTGLVGNISTSPVCYHQPRFSDRAIFSGVMGSSRCQTPVAR